MVSTRRTRRSFTPPPPTGGRPVPDEPPPMLPLESNRLTQEALPADIAQNEKTATAETNEILSDDAHESNEDVDMEQSGDDGDKEVEEERGSEEEVRENETGEDEDMSKDVDERLEHGASNDEDERNETDIGRNANDADTNNSSHSDAIQRDDIGAGADVEVNGVQTQENQEVQENSESEDEGPEFVHILSDSEENEDIPNGTPANGRISRHEALNGDARGHRRAKRDKEANGASVEVEHAYIESRKGEGANGVHHADEDSDDAPEEESAAVMAERAKAQSKRENDMRKSMIQKRKERRKAAEERRKEKIRRKLERKQLLEQEAGRRENEEKQDAELEDEDTMLLSNEAIQAAETAARFKEERELEIRRMKKLRKQKGKVSKGSIAPIVNGTEVVIAGRITKKSKRFSAGVKAAKFLSRCMKQAGERIPAERAMRMGNKKRKKRRERRV